MIKSDYVYFSTRTGLKIKLRTKSTDLDTFAIIWLMKDYSKFDFEIRNDDNVIDVGAHIGFFALYASQFCKNGKIFCFEPVKENYDLLLYNIKLNNIKNIFSYNCAVSNTNKYVKVFLHSDKTAHSIHVPSHEFVEIKSLTLQEIFDSNKLERCDYLKLDCEGSEYDIIESLPEEYFKKIKKIYIEYHFFATKPYLLVRLLSKLKSLSYHVIKEPLTNDLGSIYAKQYNV